MLMKTIILIVVLLWVYSLSVFKRAKLDAFYFLMGSLGLFIILVLWSKPYAVWLFSTIMTWGVGLVGDFFGTFSTLPLGHVIQVLYHERIILMNVDYECSGIVETAAFVSLISFYPVFKVQQRLWLALAGVAFIFIANILRLTFVSTSLHLFGSDSFFLAHSILGRLLFYVLMLTFYFTIFTRGQLIQVASQNRETV